MFGTGRGQLDPPLPACADPPRRQEL